MISKHAIIERKSFFISIILAYKNFSLSYCRQSKVFQSERGLLLLAFTASLILFMANLPVQFVNMSVMADTDLITHIGLIGFVSLFFLPPFLYFIAGCIFLIFRIFSGVASFYQLRLALFWSLNVSGPILIVNGLLKGFLYDFEFIKYVNSILELLIAWVISAMLAKAEQFRSKFPTFLIASAFVLSPHLVVFISS